MAIDEPKQILCIIPARSGSKSLPHKNIKMFQGKPLLAWSIKHAQDCKYPLRIVVSTDSKKYAEIALKYGAEIPCLRPAEYATDYASDYVVFKHMVDYLEKTEKYIPDILLHLRPTQPLRTVSHVDAALDQFIRVCDTYDSLRSVIPITKSPFKMYTIQDNVLVPCFSTYHSLEQPYNAARQLLPPAYLHNGYIDICNVEILKRGTISGSKIYPFLMTPCENVDIDTAEDWQLLTTKHKNKTCL